MNERSRSTEGGAQATPAPPPVQERPPVQTLGVATAADVDMVRVRDEVRAREFDDAISSPAALAHYQNVAAVMARSGIVPEHFRNKPDDVFVALHMAVTLRENPLVVLQNLYVVKGTPGFKTQFLVARLNTSGKVRKPGVRWVEKELEPPMLDATVTVWEKVGDKRSEVEKVIQLRNLEVTAYVTDSTTGETVSERVSMADAIADGWASNPKYKSLGAHMLKYRSAAFLVRLHYPEVMLGMSATVEELDDVEARVGNAQNVTPWQGRATDDFLASIRPGSTPDPAPTAAAEPAAETSPAAEAAEGSGDDGRLKRWGERLSRVVPSDLVGVWFREKGFKGCDAVDDVAPEEFERFEAALAAEEAAQATNRKRDSLFDDITPKGKRGA